MNKISHHTLSRTGLESKQGKQKAILICFLLSSCDEHYKIQPKQPEALRITEKMKARGLDFGLYANISDAK